MKQNTPVVVAHSAETWDQIEPAWAQLAATALDPNPFFTPTFLRAYQTHLARGRIQLLAVAHPAEQRLVAALPLHLTRSTGLWHTASTVVGDYGTLGTLLCSPEATCEEIAALIKAAVQRSPGRTLALPYHAVQGATFERLQHALEASSLQWHIADQSDRAYQAGDPDAEATLSQALNSKSGKRVQRYGRQLARKGELTQVSFTTPEDINKALADFIALEAAGWKGRQGTALANQTSAQNFTQQMFRDFANTGNARIDALCLDGAPIAIKLWLRQGNRFFGWKTTFDETHAKVSPGPQLLFYSSHVNLDTEGFEGADSLTTPDNRMANTVWHSRFAYGTIMIGSGSRFAVSTTLIKAKTQAQAYAKTKLKALLGRR